MADYDNEMRGVLFVNDRKQPGEQTPDYRGTVTVRGVEYRLAGWKRKSKQGTPFLSLALSPPGDGPRTRAGQPPENDDDSIPF